MKSVSIICGFIAILMSSTYMDGLTIIQSVVWVMDIFAACENFLESHCDREHVIFSFSLRQEMMDIAILSGVVVGVLLRYASLILVDGRRLCPKIGCCHLTMLGIHARNQRPYS